MSTSTPASTKAFASQADLDDKKITFEQLSAHCWAYTAEGDPNSGVIIGDRFIMVSDATATPAMARDLIARIREVSDKPIKYVLLTHYHAVRVLGASAYVAEGATEIIASQGTLDLIHERGAQDMKSEMERFPRLFRNAESVPGLTWPTLVIGGGNPAKGEAPGKLTVTPTPQQSINLPSGATFAFENGIRYETVMVPGGAGMGDPVYDWKGVFPNASGTVDVGDIEMYTVEAETIPPGTPNGGLCDKPFIFAVYPHIDSQGEVITIAAFTGDGWPPEKPDTALCGTFSYSAVK